MKDMLEQQSTELETLREKYLRLSTENDSRTASQAALEADR